MNHEEISDDQIITAGWERFKAKCYPFGFASKDHELDARQTFMGGVMIALGAAALLLAKSSTAERYKARLLAINDHTCKLCMALADEAEAYENQSKIKPDGPFFQNPEPPSTGISLN